MVDHRALEIEADRILDVADRAGVVLRLEGSVAILGRCPNRALLASGDHVFRDIDFAARKQRFVTSMSSSHASAMSKIARCSLSQRGRVRYLAALTRASMSTSFTKSSTFATPYICRTGFGSTCPHFRWQSCSWPTAQGVFQQVLNDEILSGYDAAWGVLPNCLAAELERFSISMHHILQRRSSFDIRLV